jgi:hypothetical protein
MRSEGVSDHRRADREQPAQLEMLLRHKPIQGEKSHPVPESLRVRDAGEARWIEIKTTTKINS